MVEVDGLSGFWLAAGRLCYAISVIVPVAFAVVVVVLLLVAAWKGVVALVRAIVRIALHREDHIDSCDHGISQHGGGHLWL